MKSVKFNDGVALLLSVAGLVMGPHVTYITHIYNTETPSLC